MNHVLKLLSRWDYFSSLLDADRKKVTDHRDGLIAARTTLQNDTAACADRERPDLAPLQLALADATQTLNAANAALATARTDVSSLTKFKESLAAALTETERLETETGPLRCWLIWLTARTILR